MTIKQFQELYFISTSDNNELDKSIRMVGAVKGITPDEVEKLPMAKFNKVCAKINKSFEVFNKKLLNTEPVQMVKVNGRCYQLHYRVERSPINAGRYVEVVTFQKDIIGNLHRIMASICEPIRWNWRKMKYESYPMLHEDIALDMEALNFEAAYHAAVFFYTLYGVSMNNTRRYLMNKLTAKGITKEVAEEVLTHSQSLLDGLIMPKWSVNLKTYLLNRFGV